MDSSKQIFQTQEPTRWNSVKWTKRVLAVVAIFFLTIIAVALFRASYPSIPVLKLKSKTYSLENDPDSNISYYQNKKIKGFKDFLTKKEKEDSIQKTKNEASGNSAQGLPFIRAAFYTPWTASTSLPDLERYGDKINTIFPEWFFIDSRNLKLNTRIDSAGLSLMRSKNLRIMPMLSNFNSLKQAFDGKLLHKILNDTATRNKLIQQIADTIKYYRLSGINVDFEDLLEPNSAALTAFQKKLYETLHRENTTVTMDVATMNNDYDYKQLSDYNDYIILMAYDQYNNATGAGPISEQRWIEEAVDWTAKKIPANKLILGIGCFGYDWVNGKQKAAYTYNDAINTAKEVNAQINYNNDSYNLHFSYLLEESDEKGETEKVIHHVWFNDAATAFNILRFSDEYQMAGTALWRLGSEDPRIWNFYNLNLSNNALQVHPFNFTSLTTIPILPNNVALEGDGEILDIVSLPQEGKIHLEIDRNDQLIAEQKYQQLPSGYVIRRFAEDTTIGSGHKLILTFDDGPSSEYTPQILDILEKEKIPASFFIVGLQAEQNIPLLKRIYQDGFEIGNHTFTHHNIAKMSLTRASLEMKLTRLLIESITGRSTILFRAPYNADSEPQTYEELEPIARSRSENYLTVGESIDPLDWEPQIISDSIVTRVIKQVETRNARIILLHDAGGQTRQATVDALPKLIRYFKNKGYKFTTIADLMGATKNDVMPIISTTTDNRIMKIPFLFVYWGSNIIFSLFIVGIILSIGRIAFMALLASFQKMKERKEIITLSSCFNNKTLPLVSIIIPAYNEEINAVKTVKSILAQSYTPIEVIVVDDGSKDATYNILNNTFGENGTVHVYTKQNGGKATALNYGISISKGEFIVCIDADTQLKTDAVSQIMKCFTNAMIGAVAGNVKVGNEVNMITKWQSIEYITSQNFDRRAFDLLNCITVVPGAIGAFRKDAVVKAGGFSTDTLAEDCDLTMRLLRNNYMIRNCNEAISYTEAPETFKQFIHQRFRWSFGIMQCFWKHRDTIFNPRYKNFGMIAMPNILIFQMLLPFLAPLADLILVLSLIAASFNIFVASVPHIIIYYLLFTLVDLAGAALAFAFEKEDLKKLIWLLPQRLVYRQLMYYILIKSFNKAVKGELQGWGSLKRTGRVRDVAIQAPRKAAG